MSDYGGGLNGSTQHFILNGKMECMQMTRRYGRGFSASEKTELWDRWQRGESLKAIGRAFDKPSSSIYFQLAPHGGIRRWATPASRPRPWTVSRATARCHPRGDEPATPPRLPSISPAVRSMSTRARAADPSQGSRLASSRPSSDRRSTGNSHGSVSKASPVG